MMRNFLAAVLIATGGFAMAQDFSGLARLDQANSAIVDRAGGVKIDLYLSQVVPYRVFALDDPRRIVLDFREIDWQGADKLRLSTSSRVSDLRFGALRPGWSRMVLDLALPLTIAEAGMSVNPKDGGAHLRVIARPASEAEFAAAAGAPPHEPGWQLLTESDSVVTAAPPPDDGILRVAIDAGHGGIDPGAERGGLVEADLTLTFARELAEAIRRETGIEAIMTRDSDVFVALEQRMTIARQGGADLFISLHVDALEEDDARGASVYTLSDDAQDIASERMAERHDRGDLLAGLDLSGQDDTIATVLMDLARVETGPKSLAFADVLTTSLAEEGARLNSRPRRDAVLAVLNAADFASVLLELGFLSNGKDREIVSSSEGRAVLIGGILKALRQWSADEAVRTPLIRQ